MRRGAKISTKASMIFLNTELIGAVMLVLMCKFSKK